MGSNALQEKDAPRPDHYSQALISAKVLNAPNIHIIYIERPTFDAILWEDEPAVSIRQWRMPTDFDKAETIMHRLSVVHTLHQRGFLSARRIGNMTQDPEKGWGACRYCHYKERCIELGDGVIRADGLSSLRSPEYAHEKSQVG